MRTATVSSRMTRLIVRLTLGLALAHGVSGAAPARADYDPSDPAQAAAYAAARELGARAFEYGEPLLNMERTFRTQTSVDVDDGRGNGPVNQFAHLRHLADPLDQTVVSPNHDTLYSIAWLDLSKQPIVLSTPSIDRWHVVPLYTPYQENFANIGSPELAYPDGDYVITPPGWRKKLPDGLRQIESPYDRVWIIGRTLILGPDDEPTVHAIQDQYTLTPLHEWNERNAHSRTLTPVQKRKPHSLLTRRPADTELNVATVPGTAPGDDPLAFYDALGEALRRFPPPAADQPLLDELAAVGVGPGLRTSKILQRKRDAAIMHGLRDGIAAGQARVTQALLTLFQGGFNAHNGWLVAATGSYGTDYALRAIVSRIGLGAPTADIAVFPFAQTDRLGAPLTGATRYVAHLPAGMLPPPVDGFWSLTLYDAQQFFVPNPIDRYVLNDRSDVNYNADGSLDLYLQPTMPSDPEQAKNWLPTPAGGFTLLFRLYGPKLEAVPGILSGERWQAPTILPCLASGVTAAGWACAE